MSKPMSLRRRGKILALIIFLIGIAFITYLGAFWPAITLVIGIPLALWQYLQKRHYDMGITLFVFIGVFVTVQFDIQWQILLPVLFTIGGIYIFMREWLNSRDDEESDLNEKKEEVLEEKDEEEDS